MESRNPATGELLETYDKHDKEFTEELIESAENTIMRNIGTIEEILQLYEDKAEPTDTDPYVADEYTIDYKDQRLKITLVIHYTGEPHNFDVNKGYFGTKIKCDMDTTEILTDIKPSFYELSENLFPKKEPVVRQDYPSGSIWINYDLDVSEFRSAFTK